MPRKSTRHEQQIKKAATWAEKASDIMNKPTGQEFAGIILMYMHETERLKAEFISLISGVSLEKVLQTRKIPAPSDMELELLDKALHNASLRELFSVVTEHAGNDYSRTKNANDIILAGVRNIYGKEMAYIVEKGLQAERLYGMDARSSRER